MNSWIITIIKNVGELRKKIIKMLQLVSSFRISTLKDSEICLNLFVE